MRYKFFYWDLKSILEKFILFQVLLFCMVDEKVSDKLRGSTREEILEVLDFEDLPDAAKKSRHIQGDKDGEFYLRVREIDATDAKLDLEGSLGADVVEFASDGSESLLLVRNLGVELGEE